MRQIKILLVCTVTLLLSCKSTQPLVNTSHLDHLYEEINIDGKILGTQWIYCEAPAYNLVADEDEGFTCVDDVARALIVYCRSMKKHPNENTLHKIESLSNFILYMKADNNYFYNFMFYNGKINLTHKNSVAVPAFWTWRAYWALTELLLVEDSRLNFKKEICTKIVDQLESKIFQLCKVDEGMKFIDGIHLSNCACKVGTDQMAVMLLGMANHYTVKPNLILKDAMIKIGKHMMKSQMGAATQLPYYAFLSWQNYWHAWGNCQSYALIKAGKAINDSSMINAAMNEINYFFRFSIDNGYMAGFKLIKESNNSLQMVEKNTYAQIAYGISPMILAATEAYHLNHQATYAILSFDLAAWYFGANNARAIMYDVHTGRGLDGINDTDKINKNAGSESTIESILAMQAIEDLAVEKSAYKQFFKKYILSK